jgi:hypothetical protein
MTSYHWAVRQGLVANPIEQRLTYGGRTRWTQEHQTPAERPHNVRRHKITWLPPASYRLWRDVGVRGYRRCPTTRPDRMYCAG